MISRIAGLLAGCFVIGLALLSTPAGVSAGSCPADAGGVLEKSTYRIGELLDFYGTYQDFADPGTVTIMFTRPSDGRTRTFIAHNVVDGSWFRHVRFTSRSDAGSWRVHVLVEETLGTSTCDDRFTLRASSGGSGANPTTPNTSTDGPVSKGGSAPGGRLVVVGLGLLAVAVGLAGVGRARRGRR